MLNNCVHTALVFKNVGHPKFHDIQDRIKAEFQQQAPMPRFATRVCVNLILLCGRKHQQIYS